MKMKTLDLIVAILLVVGGLNWGLVGLFDFNVIEKIFGGLTPFTRLIYVIVGLAALYDLLLVKIITRRWDIHFKRPAHA